MWSSAREIAAGDVVIIWLVRPVNNVNDDDDPDIVL